MTYVDIFQPRRFQRDVIKAVLDGMASGRDTSIVLAAPGSGKTLAYQAAATYLYREGLIDYAAVFAPRIILARQCETSWMARQGDRFVGNHELFDSRRRFGAIRHVPNNPPLTSPGQHGVGFVATYSALVSNQSIYESWAKQHRGRFLLVADEAQFCGASDERSSGTRAGSLVETLHTSAAHTLLLTGTPYRSDGNRLILADYDTPDENGRRALLWHAEATYFDGVADGYLRRFEATVHDARIRWRDVDNTTVEYDLSKDGADLAEVLRKPQVWQPIVDMAVNFVRDKQKIHGGYRGLISCMEQGDAKKVASYLRQQYPDLRVLLAISEDGPEAERALRDFQSMGGDVLVTVRKAFIGYDCPEITVVGILTHYRDPGHLMQLVGRGLRTWKKVEANSQSLRVVAPDDPRMQQFIEVMRGESEEGLRERRRREDGEGPGGGEGPIQDELGWVESAYATTARVLSADTELDHTERVLYESIKRDIGSVEDVSVLAKFAAVLGLRNTDGRSPAPSQDRPAEKPLTEQEQIDGVNTRVADEIRSILAARGIYPADSSYGEHARKITNGVNRTAGYRAGECRTVEQAEARLRAAMSLRETVS